MGIWYSLNLVYLYPFIAKKIRSGIIGDFMICSDQKIFSDLNHFGDLELTSHIE